MKNLLILLAIFAVCNSANAQSFSSYVWEQKAKYEDTIKHSQPVKHKHNKNCSSHLGITTHPAKYTNQQQVIDKKYDDTK